MTRRTLARKPTSKMTASSKSLSPATRAFLDTKRVESRFLGDVQHLLIERLTKGDGRATDFLHPSDVSKNDWCQRAAYYGVIGAPKKDSDAKPRWRRGSIYNEGHMIHDKWQAWFWDLGILEGQYYCLHCQYAWWATAPVECENCGLSRKFLIYQEVAVGSSAHLLYGHGDGLARDVWHEYKSVAKGTLFFENPTLLEEHTYNMSINGKRREFIDYDGLWDSIRRPFPGHLRQGRLYVALWNREHPDRQIEEIAYIYECKWNQDAKEFIVKFREDQIRDRLAACMRIADAVRNQPRSSAPVCSWDEEKGCPECRPYDTARNAERPRRRLQRTVLEDGGGPTRRSFTRRSSQGTSTA